MKRIEVLTNQEKTAGNEWTSKLVVRFGVPSRADGHVSLSPGVRQGDAVLIISQDSGNERTRQGVQLQAVSAAAARDLARAILEAIGDKV